MRYRSPEEQGSFALVSLFFMALLSLRMTVGLTRAMHETVGTQYYVNNLGALHAAESGIDAVINQLSQPEVNTDAWRPETGWTQIIPQTQTRYQITSYTPPTGTPRVARFTVEGQHRTVTTRVQATITVTPPAATPGGVGTIFGSQLVYFQAQDTLVDAYDSNDVSTYSPVRRKTDAAVIRTNRTTGGNVIRFTKPGISVYGQAYLGPGSGATDGMFQYDYSVDPSGTVPASWQPTLNIPPVPAAPAAGCKTHDFSASNELVLTAGTYNFCALDLGTNHRIRTTGTGQVTVNVSGRFRMQRNSYIQGTAPLSFTINDNFELATSGTLKIDKDASGEGDPTKLRFYLSGNTQSQLVGQQAPNQLTVYGLIYGPDRNIDLNPSSTDKYIELYGGIIGHDVMINSANTKIHVDVALNNAAVGPGTGAATVELVAWQQL